MKTLIIVALLALPPSSFAGEINATPQDTYPDRLVADALEVETLPTGEVVTRLVSRHGITARKFWTNSVYGDHKSILVFRSDDNSPVSVVDTGREPHLKQKYFELDPDWSDKLNQGVRSALEMN